MANHPYTEDLEILEVAGFLFARQHIYSGDLGCQPSYGVGGWNPLPLERTVETLREEGYSIRTQENPEISSLWFPREIRLHLGLTWEETPPVATRKVWARKHHPCACLDDEEEETEESFSGEEDISYEDRLEARWSFEYPFGEVP